LADIGGFLLTRVVRAVVGPQTLPFFHRLPFA
jgi:hypothetical protein